MAITLVGAESGGGFQAATTVAVPAGVQSGDLLVMLATANDHPGVTWPDRWTLARTTVVDGPTTTWVLYRHATDDEPSVYEVVWEDSHWHFVAILAWRGAAGIRATASATGTGIDQLALPSLDARVGDVLVAFGYHWSETSKNWSPAGLTTVANLPRGIIASYETTTAGPTPAYTLIAGTTGHMAATAILLEPPAGPSFPPNVTVELQVDGSWVDITGDVRVSDDITITRGRRDEASQTDPGRMSLVLNNRHGRYSPRNPRSPYYGRIGRNTPIRVRVGPVVRGVWEVSAWPTRWDTSGADVWVPVDASGLLRRIGHHDAPEDTVVRGAYQASGPAAYWPMEDGEDATQAASAVPGVAPLAVSGVAWADDTGLDASGPLPVLGDSARWRSGALPTGDTGEWTLSYIYYLPELDFPGSVPGSMLGWSTTGTAAEWRVLVWTDSGTPTMRVAATDSDGATLFQQDAPVTGGSPTFTDGWRALLVRAYEDAGTVYWRVDWADDTPGNLWGFEASFAGTLGRVTRISTVTDEFQQFGVSDLAGMTVGHMAVWDRLLIPPLAALDGYAGDTAADRIIRLSEDYGVPLTVVGDQADTALVGSQGADTYLALIHAAADVDGGILYESRDDRALAYRTRADMYNQAPALVLDYSAGEVAPLLEPTEDDQQVVNDVTVKRTGGAEYRAVLEAGPLSVQAPPDGVGRYDTSVTLNAYSDDQLAGLAAWRLHWGTVDEPRYPTVRVNLGNPRMRHRIAETLAVDVGDRIQITRLPEWMPGGADLIVQGYTERINAYRWDVEFVCTPASPWTVAALLGAAEGFEDDTFDITITDGGDAPWARDDTQAHTGTWSLRSGAITHSQTSDAVVAVPDGSEELSFWYKVSSEASWDVFRVLVDGSEELAVSGEVDWTQHTLDVTGATMVVFRYEKDGATTSGDDCAWIDDVAFTVAAGPTDPVRCDTSGSALETAVDETATTLSVATTDGPVWVDSVTYPDDLPFDIQVGGEVMRVTAITGTSSPQQFTVQRSINGVQKGHNAGTDVRLAHPAIVAL